MIVALTFWLITGAIVVGILAFASAPLPPVVASASVAHPHATMRLVFVTVHDGHLVLDGLLELDPPSVGVPTTWSFACPEQSVLAAATLHVLASWADEGAPVAVDLSKVSSSRPSVGFKSGEVLVRLAALPRSVREQA